MPSLRSARLCHGADALLRCRGPLLLLTAVCILSLMVFVVVTSASDSAEGHALASSIAELQARLQHLDALHRARQEEVAALAARLGSLLSGADGGGGGGAVEVGTNATGGVNAPSHEPPLDLSAEARARRGARNIAGLETGRNLPSIRLPSVYDFLPHLLDNASSLRPAYCLSRGRSGVSVVLGIPTVKREVQSYLMDTLQNLTGNMSPEEAADTLIVVFIAETDHEYVLQVSKQLEEQFAEHVESGLMEVVSPPAAFYPDMQSLRPTLGDPPERVRWRSKQNLDFAFLMMYAQPKGTFYVQLEDDIVAKKNYISTMKNYALQKISEKSPWFVLAFSQLGFIGKMFKSVELPWVIQFLLMFHSDQPADWLLVNLISTKVCRLDKDSRYCKLAKAQLWLEYKSSLFQHIGLHSSLKGKVQSWKDKKFRK